jgi:hypothetical protein
MGAALALGGVLALSACAVSSPLEIRSRGAGLQPGMPVSLVRPEEDTGLNARFASAVERALTDRSLVLVEDARFIADISVARRDASSGIIRGEGTRPVEGQEPDWLVRPRDKERFDKCKAQRLRATLVIYDRSNGSVAYRGSGQAIACGFDDSDLAEFAQNLVADALDPAGR